MSSTVRELAKHMDGANEEHKKALEYAVHRLKIYKHTIVLENFCFYYFIVIASSYYSSTSILTDPVTCAVHGKDNDLLDLPVGKKIKSIAKKQKKVKRIVPNLI